MKPIFILLILITSFTTSFAQLVSSEILSEKKVKELFPKAIHSELKIDFPIVQAYHYTDKSGSYYCLLTESKDETFNDEHFEKVDTLNRKIKAINLKEENGSFTKIWEINDFTIDHQSNEGGELSIWFWTKYIQFKDLNGDGLIDPLLVYGTRHNFNYTGDGRLKIIVFNKGNKVVIRQQNGILDGMREAKVDPAFYQLPVKMQNSIKSTMISIENDHLTIFPEDWENQMKKKKSILEDG